MIDFATKQNYLKRYRLGIETVLSVVAISLIISIFLKVILDVDNNYDPGWYHLPFAGRLGGDFTQGKCFKAMKNGLSHVLMVFLF